MPYPPLKVFSFQEYEFIIRPDVESGAFGADTRFHLTGLALRGGFGRAFHRVACSLPGEECHRCPLKETCPYSYIFATSPPESSLRLKRFKEIPRPFVLEPLSPSQFRVVLVGRAAAYLPYFILSFRELGIVGIGRPRTRFRLIQVMARKGEEREPIYHTDDGMIRKFRLSYSFADFKVNPVPQELKIQFLTPTRLFKAGSLVKKPDFACLFQRLLERISNLAYFHCGEELKVDFPSLLSQAQRIETVHSDLGWQDLSYYSSRQQTRLKLGGFVGTVTYKGSFRRFIRFLRLGEHLHLGKGATYGFGRYRIV